MGIIQMLLEATRRGVRVHVLTAATEKISTESESKLGDGASSIVIKRIREGPKSDSSEESRTKILVVDRKEYLVVELKDDSRQTFTEAVSVAIHSTSQSTVKAYLTLFESLWEQSALYDQLEMQSKLQQEFINIAAHELRTPIQPILALVEIIGSQLDKNAEEYKITRDEFDILARNANRMERLAADILEVSRIESDSMRLERAKFDINEKIGHVINEVKKPNKAVEIRHYNPVEPFFVEADTVRVFGVISNLLENALKFTHEGRIAVEAKKREGYVQVDVRDTGTGIDPDIMPRLFTKFATTSDRGTGLGLFISRSIIEAHGGKIWARNNNEGLGATFSFTLPLA